MALYLDSACMQEGKQQHSYTWQGLYAEERSEVLSFWCLKDHVRQE